MTTSHNPPLPNTGLTNGIIHYTQPLTGLPLKQPSHLCPYHNNDVSPNTLPDTLDVAPNSSNGAIKTMTAASFAITLKTPTTYCYAPTLTLNSPGNLLSPD